MNCREVVRKLPLFVGGDLDAREASRVEDHLAACARCRDDYRRFDESRRSLFLLKGAEAGPAPDLWPSIRKDLLAAPMRRRRRPFVAAAVLLLSAGGGMLALLPGHPEPGTVHREPELVGTAGVRTQAPDPGRRTEYLLDEVVMQGDFGEDGATLSLRPLAPSRDGWDEF